MLATAMERLATEMDGDLVWTHLMRADLDAAGVHPSDADDLIDAIRRPATSTWRPS
ncbi:MAG: hypothetical protein U0V56_09015 [Actinomycetota bacterium]